MEDTVYTYITKRKELQSDLQHYQKQYKHIKSGVVYDFIMYGKMQINNDWYDAVIYMNDKSEVFVRSKHDFFSKFIQL